MSALIALIVTLVATALVALRWLRVAQVEHYLRGSVTVVASRWWSTLLVNAVIGVVAVAALVFGAVGGFVTLVLVAVGPLGLPVRGRTAKLRLTRRLKTLVAAWLAVQFALVLFLTAGVGLPLAMSGAIGAMAVPAVVDFTLWSLAPVENFISARWARRASARLKEVAPVVVAITGSYGKTTTKALVAHLLSGTRNFLATPSSWNNRAGLARAVNEQLSPGTDVFVAEMGTYGPGEIADMCRWFPPAVAVITAIGPVHLERFGSLDRTLTSKAEIVQRARDVVLNVDDERLAALADELAPRDLPEGERAAGTSASRVWRCSATDITADVGVIASPDGSVRITVRGLRVADLTGNDAAPTNLACAIAAVMACGMSREQVARRLSQPLPVPDHRLSRTTGAKGFTILDDTFNANPAGALRALSVLGDGSADGRRVVVTPGMVELGPLQDEANEAFAAAASEVASELVVVGLTNRRALLRGAKGTSLTTIPVATRQAAVDWVKSNLGPGDTVLYENDLPDTYP